VTEQHAPRAIKAPTDQMLALHARDIADAAGLWQDGLAAFRQALDPLDSANRRAPAHAVVQVALLRGALAGLTSSHERASGAQYGSALALVRAPFERFVETVYVGFHPEEHVRFAETPARPPSIAEMKDRLLASMLPKYGETIARGWRRKIDGWDERLTPVGPGDLPSAGFEVCMEQACGVLSLLLTQAIHVRRDLGHPDVPNVKLFAWRFARWRKHIRRARAACVDEAPT
jgi:hypothetical protein